MRLRTMTLAGLTLLVLALTMGTGMADTGNETVNEAAAAGDEVVSDEIEEYQGSVGPEHALYGLRIAFEGLDETFTFNGSQKLGKQVAHARQRIAEAKAELRKKNTEAANRALKEYEEKIKEVDSSVSSFSEEDAGLLNAQRMIVKHQLVLLNLSSSNPDNRGLQRALNNSRRLEQKFERKTALKLERMTAKGRIVLKEKEIKEQTEIEAEIEDNVAKVKVKVRFLANGTNETDIARETLNKLRLSTNAISEALEPEGEEEEEEEEGEETPTATPTANATATPTANATETATATPTANATGTATATPTANATGTATATPTANATGTATATPTANATGTATATPTNTASESSAGTLPSVHSGSAWLGIIGPAAASPDGDKLKVKVEAKRNAIEVKAEYMFTLTATDRSGIIQGINQKLSSLTVEDILEAMDVKVDMRKLQELEKKDKKDRKVEKSEKTGKERKERAEADGDKEDDD